MKKAQDILILGIYSGRRVAEHVKYLDNLREKNIVNKIYLMESNKGKGYEYPFDISKIINKKIERELPESGKENERLFNQYVRDVKSFIEKYQPDLIIPTSDKGAYLTSTILHPEKRVSQEKKILRKFQDKIKTYEFIKERNLFRTPEYLEIDKSNITKKEDEIREFMKKNAIAFAKPSYPQKGGGADSKEIKSINEIEDLLKSSKIGGRYILSEFLNFPEYNHTLIINKEGNLSSQFTYFTDKIKTTTKTKELEDFGFKFSKRLKEEYNKEDFKGVYNFDFMISQEGKFVLSEINPGRFPVSLGIFRSKKSRFNPLEALILSNSEDFIYQEKHPLNKIEKK